jgi:hypothetical protein
VLLCIERLLCPSVTNIDFGATFPGANMLQGKNTLGYLRIRTFYTRERKYAYKYASITNVWHIHLEKCKKKSFNIHSHVQPKCPTKTKRLRECWLSNLSDICRIFVGHFGRNMPDLKVWSLIHLESTVQKELEDTKGVFRGRTPKKDTQ